jgi:hypothetical protein
MARFLVPPPRWQRDFTIANIEAVAPLVDRATFM